MLIEPDFSEVQERFTPGIYRARIVAAEDMEWNGKDNKKTKVVKWTLETFGEVEPKNDGRRITYQTPVHGTMAGRLRDFYRGVMKEEIGAKFDSEMLLGRDVEMTLDFQKNKGQVTEFIEIKGVKALG